MQHGFYDNFFNVFFFFCTLLLLLSRNAFTQANGENKIICVTWKYLSKIKSEEKLFLLRKQSSSLAHCQRGESTLSTSKEARAPARIVIAKSSS